MKTLASLAIGAGILAVAALGMAEPASARGSFGVFIGGPGYYGGGPGYYGYDYRAYCRDPRYRYYHPYECDRYYDDGYYDSYYDDGGVYPGFFFFDSFGHRRFRHFDRGDRRHFNGNWNGHWNGGGNGRHHH